MSRIVLEAVTSPDRLIEAVAALLQHRDNDVLYAGEEHVFIPGSPEPYTPPIGYVRCPDRGRHMSLGECWLCWNDVAHGVITERNALAPGAEPSGFVERQLSSIAAPAALPPATPKEIEAGTDADVVDGEVVEASEASEVVNNDVVRPGDPTPDDLLADVHHRVQTILRKFLEVDDVELDDDGDYPVPFDGGFLWIEVTRTGTPQVRVISDAAHDLPFTRQVAELLNDLNRGSGHVRWFLTSDGRLRGEAELVGVTLDFPDLVCTLYELQGTATDLPKLLEERLTDEGAPPENDDDHAPTGLYL